MLKSPTARIAGFGALLLCAVWDAYGVWALAQAPYLGGQLRTLGTAVEVTDLELRGPLAQLGVREGDVLESVGLARLSPSSFVGEPDESQSWDAYDRLFQDHTNLVEAASTGTLSLGFCRAADCFQVELPVAPLGLPRALLRGLSLRLVGWSFFVVALLIWRKQQTETTLMNLLGGLGVLGCLSTLASYTSRDLAMPGVEFATLAQMNYWTAQSAILTLHLGLVFPTPLAVLTRRPWLRIFPWVVFATQGALHVGRVFPNPTWTTYTLAPLGLAGFLLLTSARLWRSREPVERAQLKWVVLGAIAGFVPWLLLTAVPNIFGLTPIPARVALLAAAFTPLCLAFAIRRYRLLDVGIIVDWVLVHSVLVTAFLGVEIALLHALSHVFPEIAGTLPAVVVVNTLVLVLAYAPLRTWLLRLLARVTGRERKSVQQALRTLAEDFRTTGNPVDALERTLDRTFALTDVQWLKPDQGHDDLLAALKGRTGACLGDELGEVCPPTWTAAAFVPVHCQSQLCALVLCLQERDSWQRDDLDLACTLIGAGEPLLEIQSMRREHSVAETAMREQRDELTRELHDGLGSQLFGISLLTRAPESAEPKLLQARLREIAAAANDAIDSLRTGLTVLSSPPGAFGPSVVVLLMRAERILNVAGVKMTTHIDDEISSLQLQSKQIFGLLRTMQEALTNIARHAKCTEATVTLALRARALCIEITDNGVGFSSGAVSGGQGLGNMQRRLQSLGGHFAITSTPGRGTQVKLELDR